LWDWKFFVYLQRKNKYLLKNNKYYKGFNISKIVQKSNRQTLLKMSKKYIFLYCITLLFAVSVQSQQFIPAQSKTAAQSQSIISVQGLSTTSAMLVTDLVLQTKDVEQLKQDYRLLNIGGRLYVNAFVEMAEGRSFDELASYEVKINTQTKEMATACIPLDRFVELAESGLCVRLEAGKKVEMLMDRARTATHADQVQAGLNLPQAYDGTDVVVGIIDIGFEYGHPNFYDSTGTTLRLKRVWSQIDTSGTYPTPVGFSYGAELTTPEQMLAERYSSNDHSHGSHVAGMAAGSGGGTTTGAQYKGMAPNADLVFVASNQDDAGIVDGINYIATYARSVGKPCVINMSLGSHLGPHDGTSSFDRMTLSYTNEHPHGLLLVGACGNEGSDKLHFSHTFSEQDTTASSIVAFAYPNYYPGYLDIWGSADQDYQVAFVLYNTSTGEILDSTDYYPSATAGNYYVSLEGSSVTVAGYLYAMGTDIYNMRSHMSAYIMQRGGSYYGAGDERVIMTVKSSRGTLHAWGTYATFTDADVEGLQDGDSDYTVGEIGGSGEAMISVGSYTTRNSFTNITGRLIDYSYYGSEGALSYFSSHGPTADGRTKPEITAPGQLIISSFNRFDNSNSVYNRNSMAVATETFGGNTEWWGAMQGTSMACPAVTGIMALWLQATPELTIAQAKALLTHSAINDEYTDSIPEEGSNYWGWGKINAMGGFGTMWYTVTSTPNDTAFGTVEGSGTYEEGTVVTLTATAKEGYTFEGWSNGVTSNPFTFTLTGDTTITALFHLHTEGIGEAEGPSYRLAVQRDVVSIWGAEGESLTIYDIMGRVVYRGTVVGGQQYRLPAAGVYMVRVGNAPVRKVVTAR